MSIFRSCSSSSNPGDSDSSAPQSPTSSVPPQSPASFVPPHSPVPYSSASSFAPHSPASSFPPPFLLQFPYVFPVSVEESKAEPEEEDKTESEEEKEDEPKTESEEEDEDEDEEDEDEDETEVNRESLIHKAVKKINARNFHEMRLKYDFPHDDEDSTWVLPQEMTDENVINAFAIGKEMEFARGKPLSDEEKIAFWKREIAKLNEEIGFLKNEYANLVEVEKRLEWLMYDSGSDSDPIKKN